MRLDEIVLFFAAQAHAHSRGREGEGDRGWESEGERGNWYVWERIEKRKWVKCEEGGR